MKANKDIFLHTFIKKHFERKMKNIFASSHTYVSDIKSKYENIYETINKGPK